MHIYGRDQQAFHLTRTRAEKWFSRVNTLIVAVQLVCFICALIRTSMNTKSSMHNSLFVNSKLDLTDAYLVPGCVYPVTRSHAFFSDVAFNISADNIGYFVSRSVLNIRYAMAISGVQAVVSMVNRAWFETNTAELRYHFVVFRKDMVTVWELLLVVLGLVVTFGLNEENSIIYDYLIFCQNGTSLGRGFYNATTPYIELYVSYFVTVAVYAVSIVVAIWNLSKPNPRKKLIKEEKARLKELEDLEKSQRVGSTLQGCSPQRVTYGDNLGQVHTDSQSNNGAPLRRMHEDEDKSVSRPFTPIREPRRGAAGEEEDYNAYDDYGGDYDFLQDAVDGSGGSSGASASLGGFELREVQDDYDYEDVLVDANLPTTPLGPTSSNRAHQLAMDSDASTALLANRHTVIPPPPPVRPRGSGGSGRMLPPPPFSSGPQVTEDTGHLDP